MRFAGKPRQASEPARRGDKPEASEQVHQGEKPREALEHVHRGERRREVYSQHVERVRREVEVFWSRLGGRPSFDGLKVLDVGCGNGLLALDAARRGARRVVGLDVEEELVAFGRENAEREAADLKAVLELKACPVEQLDEGDFDLVLSKDVLEHVMTLDSAFQGMVERLKPGGRMYLGFGPLWKSPFGGHGLNHVIGGHSVPWAHVLFPESFLIKKVNEGRIDPVGSIQEYGLNRLPYCRYRDLIFSSGLDILYYEVNKTANPLARVASLLRHVPVLGDYFTSTVYCILEKKPG